MRHFILPSILLFNCCSFLARTDNIQTIKEIGWTVTIPAGFKIDDSATRRAKNVEGQKLMEKAIEQKIAYSVPVNSITAELDHNNYFTASIKKTDSINDSNWQKPDSITKALMYRAFKSLPNMNIDSNSSSVTINGVGFKRMRLELNIHEKIFMHYTMLTTWYRGYYFGFAYMYMDEAAGAAIEKTFREAIFTK